MRLTEETEEARDVSPQTLPAPADDDAPVGPTVRRRRRIGYGLLVVVPVIAGVLALAEAGRGGDAGGGSAHGPGGSSTAVLLLAAAAVLVVARGAGALAERLGQPRVIGEICAGLALGPTLLGRLAPDVFSWIFPKPVVTGLDALAQLGLVLFMFGVGQELSQARRTAREAQGALLVTLASFLVPFATGAALALWLFPRYEGVSSEPTAFALFLGCALSVTAFPVLARILADLGLLGSKTGRLSLYAAAVGDGVCWLVLTVALALAQGDGPGTTWQTLLLSLLATAVLLGPVRAGLKRVLEGPLGRSPAAVLTLCTAGVAASAGLTAQLGIHQLIGAFVFGLAWPTTFRGQSGEAQSAAVHTLAQLLLPFFFLGFGLSLDLGELSLDMGNALLLGGMLVAAMVSKILGAGLAGWLSGLTRTDSLVLGVLMNTRGLTELVVLGIGHQAGVIDDQLFAVLVLVTLVTTAMTGPGLRLIQAAVAARRK
ncbi:cation:proton antiporter [Streptomyces sp. NPDC086554]|uniref:cation:proton antiporter domain-containing protein n=1 Tax=Streptomyces sp. NPDC086554 TaxID=3154864 RepID=UPI003415E723